MTAVALLQDESNNPVLDAIYSFTHSPDTAYNSFYYNIIENNELAKLLKKLWCH